MKVLCISLDGYSASSRDSSESISQRVVEVAKNIEIDLCIETFESPWFRFPETKVKRFLKKHPPTDWPNLFLIGKSFGGAKIHDMLRKGIFSKYPNISCVTVDPHAPFRVAGRKAPINALIYAPLMRCTNVYQIDNYPDGAEVLGARNILAKGCDHYTIVHSESVKNAITDGFISLLVRSQHGNT